MSKTPEQDVIQAALDAIANLPTGRSEEVMEGQEQAYRAVEALAHSKPTSEGEQSLGQEGEAKRIAEQLARLGPDNRYSDEWFGNFVRSRLSAILAALTPAQAEPVAERAAIVAYLNAADKSAHPSDLATAIEQGLHHRAQALAEFFEGDGE